MDQVDIVYWAQNHCGTALLGGHHHDKATFIVRLQVHARDRRSHKLISLTIFIIKTVFTTESCFLRKEFSFIIEIMSKILNCE